jgi:inosine-uridine nucleoside N-ribohydrolase
MKEHVYTVPNNKQIRVIIDTDAGAEADDQFAIVHALLTPKFDVVGIIAEHFGNNDKTDSMLSSYQEILNVVEKMGLEKQVPVFQGEKFTMRSDNCKGDSEGVKFIIEEALKKDDRPLFVLNMGAITNLASAYKSNPAIAENLIAIWIGEEVIRKDIWISILLTILMLQTSSWNRR